MTNAPNQSSDPRPRLAIGHVDLVVTDVPKAVEYFVALGMRPIHHDEDFAVLELRGGTHLVLETPDGQTSITPGQVPPFDFMVDNLPQTRQHCVDLGWSPSAIEPGRIHDNFYLDGPDGYRLRITSSHTSGRPV